MGLVAREQKVTDNKLANFFSLAAGPHPRRELSLTPSRGFTRPRLGVAAGAAAGLLIAALSAQTPSSSGVFTAAQAAAGRAAYQANCASCHMPDLGGRNEAPPLAGANFMNTWRTRTTKDLFDYMSGTMPPDVPSLAADQYLAIAAFVLQSNGAPAGTQPFTPTTAVPIGTVATGAAPAAGTQTAAGRAGGQRGGRGAIDDDNPAGRGSGRGGQQAAGPVGVTVAGEVKNYVP